MEKILNLRKSIPIFSLLNNLSGQALHAKTLEFTHPITKKRMTFDSDLPDGFQNMLNLLKNLSS